MRTRTTADCGHRGLAGTYQEGHWTREREQPRNVLNFRPRSEQVMKGSTPTSFVHTLGPRIVSSGDQSIGSLGRGPHRPAKSGFFERIVCGEYPKAEVNGLNKIPHTKISPAM